MKYYKDMNIIKILCFVLLIALGAFLFVYGGYDDSPGAQGLGLLVVLSSIYGIVRTLRAKKAPKSNV